MTSVAADTITSDLAAGAADLARQGLPVFPCLPGGKRPAIDRWEQRASADSEHVAAAWRGRYAGFNIGLACGPSRLIIVDLDVHGILPDEWRLPGIHDGCDVLAQLCEWAGQPWPVSRLTATPSGGLHLWFRAPGVPELRNTAGLLGPMVDTRAAGGYIVVPPSVIDGRAYRLLDDCDPAPLPGWLLRLLAPPRPPATRLARPAGPSPGVMTPARCEGILAKVTAANAVGHWDDTLFWAACRFAEAGVPQSEAERLITEAAQPWDTAQERLAARKIASAYQRSSATRTGGR